jgi:hypothetical protein
LEMICEERQRSVEHFAQWMREVCPFRNLSSEEGATIALVVTRAAGTGVGERWNGLLLLLAWMLLLVRVEAVEDVEKVLSLLSVLDWRDLRRKGAVEWRYCGKGEGMESECRRRKDMVVVA